MDFKKEILTAKEKIKKYPRVCYCDDLLDLLEKATNDSMAEKYNELIMAVENKYRGESRHQTALRYIKEREYRDFGTGKAVRDL